MYVNTKFDLNGQSSPRATASVASGVLRQGLQRHLVYARGSLILPPSASQSFNCGVISI